MSSLAPATVLGFAAVTPLGRFRSAVAQDAGEFLKTPPATFAVADELLGDPTIQKRMRRADRFSRMAVVAAMDAWSSAAAGCERVPVEQVGLIVNSGLGPHNRGFRFLDGMLDCGDDSALPTDFSHSVHGAAAAYIAETLALRGPTFNNTDFEIGFEQSILLAQCWLSQSVCSRVLVGAVEETGTVMLDCARRILGEKQSSVIFGEGAVFFVLGPSDIAGLARLTAAADHEKADLLIVEDPPLPNPGKAILAADATCVTTFTPFFGQSASSTAFALLGGLWSLAAGRALGQVIRSDSRNAAVDSVATLRPSSAGAATLLLTRCK